ncbi:hypothetical protein A3J90_04140 [candidate division WOR-1 bacterium RIFOXYC2_FULL_37_10]|uniref:Bifunctional protein HldE n=1 Tax=candidate division WOR-1 bacterium RIFOXYB2_FULL_37_13 TaxID=1802579 RepID=A0A1F4SJL1_UNCSA|nr:MAG: hypothetical protein A2246_04600 [candidate division WOR-1 bacterium RIFOXYA2_FULL_37_7]OGC19863.1 MAG: hypothetical protein A2310_05885 [candidate division WOR-1 bacterium RIFOXYB2_FULL_37_13]OGC32957.1 MAG: hypothetical protein A3J90_04140 [candidate division WOR-1 bacterium RIFOXYC2_FULL_37_10]
MLETHLKNILPRFKGKKVLIIGDLMLDEHIWSKVSRISPEAPVVVADVARISHVPGGSGNVAANISALSGIPYLVSTIGDDSSGIKLSLALNNLGVSTKYLTKTKERPTILKSRIIAGSQQIVRVDREDKTEISAKLSEKILQKALKLIPEVDAVIISDYGKGITSNHNCKQIIKFAQKHKKPILVDPKGSDYSKYQGATIITPNQNEAEVASGIKITDEKSLSKAGEKLLSTVKSPFVLITRSENGMSLFFKDGKTINIPAIAREVFDITGAGDSVIATLALSFASKATAGEAAYLSNYSGSVKVTKIATQPVYLRELENALLELEPSGKKIKSRKELKEITQRLKEENSKIVFTNGCFDLLHLGHVRYLKEAKKLGDILIVGLNSDSSVRKLKGYPRPYLPEHERAEIIASLESVDFVVIFNETRPDNLIKIVKPYIHVKGGDYKISELPERHIVKRYGGKIVVIPPTKGKSTTNIIEKIRKFNA